ncbi:2'-5' RNA ligase family protein [Paenibacillus abyssi]|uniref:Putative phosphoesterase GCM10010916_28480 n=1 Tax=Paenibacillus abyssi TaxID=1340531 RepID=A0A917FX61_9BACL|nr:2'-5' RNA ligase family protein [Paenibacillus abyssi]GGG09916.1 putative phosphoesterase YjcG [Paenibacillus abyssi]
MNFGIVAFPSKPVQDFANSLRKRYDPHYSSIQPHMTIREGELWDETQLEHAIQHMEEITKRWAPFHVRYNRVSTFYPVNHVIYMALEDPLPMIRFQEAINSGPLSYNRTNYVYVPHLTLGQQLSADELHDVYASLRHKALDFTNIVDRIHLLYQTENMAWTAYQSFLLRG